MIIKFTQAVRMNDMVYLPGAVANIKDKEAKQLIKEDKAIAFTEEVTNGDGSDSSEVE